MKVLLTLLFIVTITLSLNKVSACEEGKDLLNGFFTQIKGSDFHLNEECFDEEFDSDVKSLLESIKQLNLQTTVDLLKKIVSETRENCNLNDIQQLHSDANRAFFTGALLFNAAIYSQNILNIIKERINNLHPTAFEIGTFSGKITNILVYGKTPKFVSSLFLQNELVFFNLEDALDEVEHFVDGVLSGVALNSQNNQCKTDIFSFKSQIVDSVKLIVESIKTRTNISDSILNLLKVIVALPDFKGTCNLDILKQSIKSLTSKIGLLSIVYRLGSSPLIVFADLQEFVVGIKQKQYFNAGEGLGSFITLALNWHTN